jgi:hypothetical protein
MMLDWLHKAKQEIEKSQKPAAAAGNGGRRAR